MSNSFWKQGVVLFLFTFFVSISCQGQNSKVYKSFSYKRVYKIVPTKMLNMAVDITKYLPKGYKKDGSVDYTGYIQRAINDNRVVLFPNFTILINSRGLDIPSNSRLIFQKNSKLKMKPNAEQRFSILNINRKDDIYIYNPVLQGDKNSHLGKDGEWGMGIRIISSSNIEIYNPFIVDSWGDGIYLGNESKGDNKNITISGGLLDNNRRNGISIISATNLYIDNIQITNTFGTLPMAGIDVEPNDPSSKINNLNFKNIKIFNCPTGFQVSLNYYGAKLLSKRAVIKVNNLYLSQLGKGVFITGFHKKPDFQIMSGQLFLDGINTTNVDKPFVVENHFDVLPDIKVGKYNFNVKGNIYNNSPNILLKDVSPKVRIRH